MENLYFLIKEEFNAQILKTFALLSKRFFIPLKQWFIQKKKDLKKNNIFEVQFFGTIFEKTGETKIKNMKNFLTLLSFVFITTLVNAQPPKYSDLQILYADANYEKLAKVAANYTEKDKTKKDVLPYIWLAKGLYKISLSGTTDPRFKNAYKDAIKYLSKGMKYDLKYNEGSTIEEHREFVDEFQMSLFEVIDNEMSGGSSKRAGSWVIKYQKITTNPVGAKYLLGATKYMNQDKSTARTLWKEADAMLEALTTVENFSEADLNMLKIGLLYTAQTLKDTRQIDKARALLNKAAQWFENDADWKERYDEIVN